MPNALESIRLAAVEAEPATAHVVDELMVGGFTASTQQLSNWCWAAVGSELYNFWVAPDIPVSQSWFAAEFGNTTQNEPRDATRIIRAMETKIDTVPRHAQLTRDDLRDFAGLKQKIATAIRDNKPVPLAIAWRGGRDVGHMICVLGLSSLEGESAMIVYDPSDADAFSDNLRRVPFHRDYFNSYRDDGEDGKDGEGQDSPYREYQGFVTVAFVP